MFILKGTLIAKEIQSPEKNLEPSEKIEVKKPITQDEKNNQPNQPKVESHSRGRKIPQKVEKAVVEGDLKDIQDATLEKLDPNSQSPEQVVTPDSLPENVSDDAQSDHTYDEVDPNAPVPDTETNSSESDIHKPLPDLAKRISPKGFSSKSASGQITVLGSNAHQCSQLSSLAESYKAEFLEIIGEKDAWKREIMVKLIGSPGELPPSLPIVTELQIISDTPIFTINIHIGLPIDLPFFKQKFIETLICERALRNLSNEFIPETLDLPQWLVIGLAEAILWRKGQADQNLYAMLFDRGEVMNPDELIKIKDPLLTLDGSTLGVFRASSGALVLCLINQGGGKDAFKKLIDRAFPKSVDDATLLKQVFPNLHVSQNSLHKWWALQLATIATPPLTQAFNALQSEEKLKEGLKFSLFDSTSNTIQELDFSLKTYESLQKLPLIDRNNLLRLSITQLIQLSYRAFPPQRPIILEYIRILEEISRNNVPKNLETRLTNLTQERDLIHKAGLRTRDYLDWYTIVNASQKSGTFDQYLKTIDLLKKPVKQSPTPISEYLDDIEKYKDEGQSSLLDD